MNKRHIGALFLVFSVYAAHGFWNDQPIISNRGCGLIASGIFGAASVCVLFFAKKEADKAYNGAHALYCAAHNTVTSAQKYDVIPHNTAEAIDFLGRVNNVEKYHEEIRNLLDALQKQKELLTKELRIAPTTSRYETWRRDAETLCNTLQATSEKLGRTADVVSYCLPYVALMETVRHCSEIYKTVVVQADAPEFSAEIHAHIIRAATKIDDQFFPYAEYADKLEKHIDILEKRLTSYHNSQIFNDVAEIRNSTYQGAILRNTLSRVHQHVIQHPQYIEDRTRKETAAQKLRDATIADKKAQAQADAVAEQRKANDIAEKKLKYNAEIARLCQQGTFTLNQPPTGVGLVPGFTQWSAQLAGTFGAITRVTA